ncbi:MAG: glycosyltransferase [Bacteriovoracaceae bacterium]
MILITTPDYFPKLGGLSTLTLQLENSLREMGLSCEVFQWNSWKDIKAFSKEKLQNYKLVINIHYLFGFLRRNDLAVNTPMVNFICGTEILFTSPTWWKRGIKKLTKKSVISHIESCHLNLFISEFTHSLIQSFGFKPSSARDIIYHCGIDAEAPCFFPKNSMKDSKVVKFACIARDVKHKNLVGAVKFCELVKLVLGKEVVLTLPQGVSYQSEQITIENLLSKSEEDKLKAFKEAHFNLLLSLPDYQQGFVEGFGLTVLEAGLFGTPSIVMNTGGLTDSVHDNFTGWVINQVDIETVKDLFQQKIEKSYTHVSKYCFEHTLNSHNLNSWRKIFYTISKIQEAA